MVRRVLDSFQPRHVGPAVVYGLLLSSTLSGTPTAGQAAWSVSVRLTIGRLGAGEGHDLFDVRDAAVLPDGRIAVVSAKTHDLRIFDAEGRFLMALGREGQGPGEFWGSVRCIDVDDDGLLAFDPALRRLTYFDSRNEFDHAATLDYPATMPGSVIQCPFRDGSHLVVRSATFFDRAWANRGRSTDGLRTEKHQFLRYFDGTLDTLLVRDLRTISVTYEEGGQRATLGAPPPFSPPLLWTLDSVSLAVGYGDTRGIELYDPRGSLMGVIHPSGSQRPVSRADRDAYRRWYLAEGGSTGMRPLRELVLDRAPWGEMVPLLDRLQLDELGYVWLGEYTLEGATRTWQVKSRSGHDIARVDLPRQLEVFEIGFDYVLGKLLGDFDEEQVLLLDLRRTN